MMSVPRTTVRENRHREAGDGDEAAVGMNGFAWNAETCVAICGTFRRSFGLHHTQRGDDEGKEFSPKRELQFGSDRKIRLTVSRPSDTVPTNLRIETPLDAMMVEGPWRLRRGVM